MQILYLTNGFPYPLTSGYLRHYYLIKHLSQKHHVTLLSITGRNFTSDHAQVMASMVESVYTFPTSNSNLTKAQKILRRIQSFSAQSLQDAAGSKMKSKVEELFKARHYDLIFFSGRETYPAIEGIKDIPIIVDLCDAFMLRIRGRMRYTNPIYLPYLFLEYMIVRKVEQRLIDRAAHVLFASVRDMETMKLGSQAQASVIPNGIDLDYWKRSTTQRGKENIIFSGGMDYPPNADAAIFLIEQVFPLIRQSHPTAQLWIVGRDPGPQLIEAGRKDGIHVTGFVDDMRSYLEQATVFAAPLRFGAGIQNKVLEAMAMMLPVVASPLAADGLRTEEGCVPPIKVANSPSEYAHMISDQIDLARSDLSPIQENRQYVEEHFVWERIGSKLDNIVERVFQLTG